MKNINLSLITLLSLSLLIGCGMKGPLYQEAPKTAQAEEKQVTTITKNDKVTQTEQMTQ